MSEHHRQPSRWRPGVVMLAAFGPGALLAQVAFGQTQPAPAAGTVAPIEVAVPSPPPGAAPSPAPASSPVSSSPASSSPASSSPASSSAAVAAVDGKRIEANRENGPDWPTVGRDYAETRFSPLRQIDSANVNRLGLAWAYPLESTRGVEATPVVVDGVMYVSAPWSVVHAIDTRTGKRLWTFDPEVPRESGKNGCCDVVNRGVALHDGKVYVGSFDGRLIALDAATGRKVWEQDTIIDRQRPYTVTGAPRVYNGKVIIGNGGAEYGVRGYITAYDAKTGEQVWRWFTVPGDPSKPFENDAMKQAAATWDPAGRYWEAGGGGTVWNSMVFDPELNLMYIGTGNGSPWSHRMRSPAGGDNLFLSSIVALNPDTGQYVWHYQETPGDNWDYTATQDLILADLPIDGKPRKVVLHAPKNGFFYVIDRTDGRFISARNFVDVNWASGYDANGRPIEIAAARDPDKPRDAIPGPFGAHNWQSMSWSPVHRLAYFPAQHVPLGLQDDKSWHYDVPEPGAPMSNTGWNTAKFLVDSKAKPFGRLVAWDPIGQKEAWRVEYVSPWNGGTLATAGNLVFQGTADGRFLAYDAATGKKLWEAPTGTGVVAAPVTYEVDGRQYVSIAVGWGGVYGLTTRATDFKTPGTVYTFALDGKAPMPERVAYQLSDLVGGIPYDPKDVEAGQGIYVANCLMCHGVPGVDRGGALPNLAYLPGAYVENLSTFLFDGAASSRGMPDFTGRLDSDDVRKLQAFILGTADAIRPKKP